MGNVKHLTFTRYGGLSPLKQDHYETGPDKGFHNPPCRYGLYAMPTGYFETFLLGATYLPCHVSGKSEWLRDDAGQLVEDTRDFEYVRGREKTILTKDLKALLKKRNVKEKQLWSARLTEKPACPIDPITKEEFDDCDGEKGPKCIHWEACQKWQESKFYLIAMKPPRMFEHTGEIWHHLETNPHKVLARNGSWVQTTYADYIEAFNQDLHRTAKDSYGSRWSGPLDFANRRIINPYKRSFGVTYCKDHLEVFIEKIKTNSSE